MIFKKKAYLGLIAAAFLAAGCDSDVTLGYDGGDDDVAPTGEMTVELSVSLQKQSLVSRANEYDFPSISDGSHIDKLIFSVFEETKKGGEIVLTPIEITPGHVAKEMTVDFTEGPVELKLALDAEKEYRIAFWAQNSDVDIFDAGDLRELKVNYDNAINNDELRDAFAGNVKIAGKPARPTTVILHRPFAQLNLGTAGWDYEGASQMEPDPSIITESKVTVWGVAQYYNVALGESIIDENHKITVAEFSYNKLPAFINVSEPIEQWTPYDDEQFLKVLLYGDDNLTDMVGNTKESAFDFFPYLDWNYFKNYKDAEGEFKGKKYPDNDGRTTSDLLYDGIYPYTEVFKYMSMCYVLVPEAGDLTDKRIPNVTKGAVLDKVVFGMKGKILENGEVTEKECVFDNYFEITNVPVQKNWRTNIVGNNLFILSLGVKLYVVPYYCGDYDQLEASDEWHGDETPRPGNPHWPDDDDYY